MSNTSPLPIPAVDEAPTADPFLALLTDCDTAAANLFSSVPAVASLAADLVARNAESTAAALREATSSRSSLLARKTRVLGSATHVSTMQRKVLVANFEAADVSVEQLRVWAAVAGAACADSELPLECAFTASLLLASPQLAQSPATGLSSIIGISLGGELGSVATGDGLRVVSAAGSGLNLKWFEPHSRNEFSVVLAQADGGLPVWLTTADVDFYFISSAGTLAAAGATVGAAASVRTEWVRQGAVSAVYGFFSEDVPEAAVLQLSVCGVPVTDAAGDNAWRVRVPRKPLAGHECAAVGTHVRTVAVVKGRKLGMAVSTDEKWLVVGLGYEGTLSVYSLPGGELVRTFGGRGGRPLQFRGLSRLCFALNGNLVVVESWNMRLQEVTLEGVFVRFIGEGEFDAYPFCVAVHDDVIAVGFEGGVGPRVALVDFGTGAVTSRFGELGTAAGQLSKFCTGIRFTPDGSHVIVAEWEAERLSLFTTAGVFVRCVGVGMLGEGHTDVLQSVTGEYVVASPDSNRVCVFSPDGSELVRIWGVNGVRGRLGTGDECQYPTVLAAAGQHLYVMGDGSDRVHLFL